MSIVFLLQCAKYNDNPSTYHYINEPSDFHMRLQPYNHRSYIAHFPLQSKKDSQLSPKILKCFFHFRVRISHDPQAQRSYAFPRQPDG